MKYALVEKTFNAGLEECRDWETTPAEGYPIPENYVKKIKNLLGPDYVEITED